MKRESKAVHWGDRRASRARSSRHHADLFGDQFSYGSTETLDRVFARELEGPSYTRFGNPTLDAVQELIRELEGSAYCAACASGMAALHLALWAR